MGTTPTEVSGSAAAVAPRARLSSLFSFPNPVNEVSARLVAGGVVVMSACAIGFRLPWLIAVIAYGFVARVLSGPTLSPLGQLVTRVITPRLPLQPSARWPARPSASPRASGWPSR